MDIHSKLQALDFLVIGAYIFALIFIGMWVSFRRRGADDLFLGGRSQGWQVVGLSIFGTNVNPSFLISSCAVAYASGFAAANFEWLAWWLMMLLAMLFIPYYMRTRVSTMPEFMLRRFGGGVHRFLSYYALFTTIVSWLGLVLYTGGLLFSQIMAWPLWVSLVVLMGVAASFTVIGGLAAVMVTDAFQTVLMICGAATLTLIGLHEVGGVTRLIEQVPASYWQLLQSGDQAEYPWVAMLLGYPVAGIWFWCADQTIVLRHDTGGDIPCRVEKASAYDLHFRLPENLPTGEYQVYAHNGLGGLAGWSPAQTVRIAPRNPWPTKVFNIADYGAKGIFSELGGKLGRTHGMHDDSDAVAAALKAAADKGGGIVLFPAGSTLITRTMNVPRYTVLRGESRERSWIWFPDGIDHGLREQGKACAVGFMGQSDFGFESLSIHSVYNTLLIAAPLHNAQAQTWRDLEHGTPGADHVFVRNCYVFQEPTYRYQYRKDDTFLTEQRMGGPDSAWGMRAAIALHGDHISVTDCQIKGAGMPVMLMGCRYATLARNRLITGTAANGFAVFGGFYPKDPMPDKCIFEDNEIRPWSGVYFMQVLRNVVDQGRFHGHIGDVWTTGYSGTGYYRSFLDGVLANVGHVFRENCHQNDSGMAFWAREYFREGQKPTGAMTDVGMVVEDNRFENSQIGIDMREGVSAVLKHNVFDNVDEPVRYRE